MMTSHLSELKHIKVLLLTGFGRYELEGMRPLGRPRKMAGQK
jgi:hypothetical protein